MVHLQNGGLQRRDGIQDTIVTGVNAIETEAETTHVELSLGEVLDTSRIVDMAQDLMGEGRLQLAAASLEECELLSREAIKVITVGTHEMTEHRTGDHCILM